MSWCAAKATPRCLPPPTVWRAGRVPSGRASSPRARLTWELKTETGTLNFVCLMARGMA